MGPLVALRRSRSGIGLLSAIALLAAAGCSTAVPSRAAGSPAGNQGQSWEVVMPGGESRTLVYDGSEYDRLDEALNNRPDEPIVGAGAWPEPSRPSLDRAAWLYLPQRANQVLYYRRGLYPTPHGHGPMLHGTTAPGRRFYP